MSAPRLARASAAAARAAASSSGVGRGGWKRGLAGPGWPGTAGRTQMGRVAGMRRRGIVLPGGQATEDGHDDQPAIGQLVVADDGVAVVDLPGVSEALEKIVGRNGAVEHLSGRIEARALLGEDRHSRVDDLDDMVRPDRQGVIGRIAEHRLALRSLEALAEAVEADQNLGRRIFPRGFLFDGYRCQRGRPVAGGGLNRGGARSRPTDPDFIRGCLHSGMDVRGSQGLAGDRKYGQREREDTDDDRRRDVEAAKFSSGVRGTLHLSLPPARELARRTAAIIQRIPGV